MRYLFFLLMVGFAITIASSAHSHLYEYRDVNGNLRFTDDPGNVPEEQWENVKQIHEVSNISSSSGSPELLLEIDNDEVPETQETIDQEEINVDFFEIREALWQEQVDLQAEYDHIEEMKARLGNSPGEGASREDLNKYREKIEAINSKVMEYQERLDNHEDRVRKYNAENAELQ
jgi:hypothetical protein